MRLTCFIGRTGIVMALGSLLALGAPGTAPGQELASRQDPPASAVGRPSPAADGDIKAIDDDYDRQVLALERGRLERLAQLAARQKPAVAAATYEKLFRLAVAANLFGDAEAAAKAVLAAGSPSPLALGLAHTVKIIAEVDRGDAAQSLQSLRQAIEDRDDAKVGSPRAELPTDEVVEICDAYYQRLLQGAHYDSAEKALKILLEHTSRPALKAFVSSRLKRLELVGKPAPAIRGVDLDGKPFDLGDLKGKKAVLVVFWASWCLPCQAEVESLRAVEETYRGRGFQVVGINLDPLSAADPKSAAASPNIRRFLLDNNETWPTLVNGQGDKDYAEAYGVTEIPANVLVGRDGSVVNIDLVRKNLDPMIARELGR
jgi:thiol-disulfide isomerase/thioredoxin